MRLACEVDYGDCIAGPNRFFLSGGISGGIFIADFCEGVQGSGDFVSGYGDFAIGTGCRNVPDCVLFVAKQSRIDIVLFVIYVTDCGNDCPCYFCCRFIF